MTSAPVNYFENIHHPKHREFINSLNNCALCSSVLELRHLKSDEIQGIKEEAYCTQCEMKTRAKIFSVN